MILLDRYIIRQYLINTLALVVILSFFIVTIDAALQLSRYWDVVTLRTSTGGEPASVLVRAAWTPVYILDLWWPRLLGFYNMLAGLVLVGAMGFTCAQLVRHRELVAMLTSGQSLFRIARPILMAALVITAIQALGQEFVMPRIAPLLSREVKDAGTHTLGSTNVPLTDDGLGRLFYAKSFDASRGTLHEVHIWERDERGIAVRRLYTDEAVWNDGGWDCTNVMATRLAPSTAEMSDHAGLLHGGVLPVAEPTMIPALRIETDLDPTMLKMKRFARFGNHLSFSQTAEMLRRLDRFGADSDEAQQTRERLQRATLGRVSAMMANMLTLMIAMTFYITREPRNMVRQCLKSAPIVMVALLGGFMGGALPLPGVPVAVSVFLPVMVLAPIAIAVVTRVRS